MAGTNDYKLLQNNIIFEEKVGSVTYNFSLVEEHVYKYSSVEQVWHWFAGCSKERAFELIDQYISRKNTKYINARPSKSDRNKK